MKGKGYASDLDLEQLSLQPVPLSSTNKFQ